MRIHKDMLGHAPRAQLMDAQDPGRFRKRLANTLHLLDGKPRVDQFVDGLPGKTDPRLDDHGADNDGRNAVGKTEAQ